MAKVATSVMDHVGARRHCHLISKVAAAVTAAELGDQGTTR